MHSHLPQATAPEPPHANRPGNRLDGPRPLMPRSVVAYRARRVQADVQTARDKVVRDLGALPALLTASRLTWSFGGAPVVRVEGILYG